VLCPAADPPSEGLTHEFEDQWNRWTRHEWETAFGSLSKHFGKLGFEPCDNAHPEGLQLGDKGMLMYCWVNDFWEMPMEME